MTSLDNQQKQLLFDYCIGLTSEKETAEAEALISSNEQAAEIHSKLKAALVPLESASSEPCPDELAESTIRRLNNAARSSQLRLEQLLATEETRGPAGAKSWFWPGLAKRLATAAAFIIVGSILITTFKVVTSYARQQASQQQCRMQLSQVFEGITRYASDHDGQLPAVAAAAGAPWWKVGYQGSENHSNTRPLWLLVKRNYISPADFVCPGSKDADIPQLTPAQIEACKKDFPDRKYMTYSFRIGCREAVGGKLLCRKVLMADLSPLFEKLPEDYSRPLKLRLDKKMLTLNSSNHKRRGQNVLFGDGRVEFVRKRHTGISEDDIFTLQNTDIYQGCEVPSRETDAFLAP